MEEIKLIKPHNEGDSDLEVAVNGKKWKINIGETENVPDFIATEVRRSIAQSDGLGLTDHREAEPEESSGESGGGESGGGNVETATIVIDINRETRTITSGAFPEWCTAANNDYIYGKAIMHNGIAEVFEGGAAPQTVPIFDLKFGIISIEDGENEEAYVELGNGGEGIEVASDMSYIEVRLKNDVCLVSGTLTISLIYIPN